VISPDDNQKSKLARITVNVTPATQIALDQVIEREGVTLTEALRRLVGYGNFVYETTQVHRGELLLRRGDDVERVILI
jgi:hypothetical protein